MIPMEVKSRAGAVASKVDRSLWCTEWVVCLLNNFFVAADIPDHELGALLQSHA